MFQVKLLVVTSKLGDEHLLVYSLAEVKSFKYYEGMHLSHSPFLFFPFSESERGGGLSVLNEAA